MIKNSIELAQILSEICTEQYTSIYYKLVEKTYSCLKDNNTLFIYVSPKRYGVALDFQTKLVNGQKNAKNRHSIVICQFPQQFEEAHAEDSVLLLDNNDQILEIAKINGIFSLSLTEYTLKTNINYTIPSQNSNRINEIQQMLLNSISEDCLKFLP